MSIHHKTIRSPLITEKNTLLRSEEGKYVFEVDPKATKPIIKSAIESLFNVKVAAVTTMIVKGKFKRVGKHSGYCSDRKKAIVKLVEGQVIDKFGEV